MKHSKYAKLFEDCQFYLHGEFKVFPKEDFLSLIKLGGGTILKREPKLERLDELVTNELPDHIEDGFKCSNFIFYDATKRDIQIRHDYLCTVDPAWLFTCIDEFKILKPN